MEDEDVDGQVTDAWAVRADNQSPQIEESLKRSSRVLSESAVSPRVGYNDVGVEENKEDRCSSDGSEDSPGKNAIDGTTSKIVFKGFKKRILAQAQENQIGARGNSHENFQPSGRVPREKRTPEGKRGKITEYAQYLGLQPAPTNNKSKCLRCCIPSTNTCAQSMFKPHQCTCSSGSTAGRSSPGTSEPPASVANPPPSSAPSAANNFRITRKVYLCAACGTYFENWNLFLHMREIHKRHICLFCLGMFGQAERLSYHLAKKHSVPETSFTSVEDFYNVFKGSCYLICCTCEKVFSETDNFYNHFCSPVQKGRASAAASETVCSLCRQSGGHSASCSLAETRDPSQNSSGIPGIPGIPGKDGHPPRNKRMLKNNRLKRSEESLLTSYQQKLSEMYARKMSMKSREASASASSGDEAALSINSESLETATTTTTTTMTTSTTSTTATTTTTTTTTDNETARSSRDTVSETIMEVSKCTDDSRGNKTFPEAAAEVVEVNSKSDSTKIESSPCPSPSMSPSRSPSPLRRQSDASLYDSVAETIMEVSRCSNDSQDNTSAEEEGDDEETSRNDARRESRDTGSETDVLVMDEVADLENDGESANGKEDYDDRLKAPTNERRKTSEEAQENETIEVTDSEDECSSNQSAAGSPARLNSTGDTEAGSSPEKESQTTSVSFTTVNATDRSLVIKICTNRNSQFSVTSANGGNYNENHDTSRESEENNNAEDSASEKHSNHSGRASANSLRNDEDEEDEQSDTDSGKLAVVDEEKPETSGEPGGAETRENERKEDEESPEGKIDAGEKLENDENGENAEKSQSMEPKDSQEGAAVPAEEKKPEEPSDGIILAAEDVPSIDVNVEGLLESMEIEDLLKRCISAASGCCVYCNHARHIAVNGKQLSLHVLAEHRFQPQHPAIIIQREQFTARVKKSIDSVDSQFFNLCSFDSARGTYEIQNPRVFECFHCRFHSLVHKDIYLHNRKMHQKTILICIMCKSTFYSYSELLCHLCPGVYAPNVSITYRCCLCTVSNLPSAFRLMVHLRKRHHSCDVCLESTGNQQRLSNHVWKHKLHHLCYRCGIAYRNKPDITKHLFWKHGTESVLCKKCLQKKWPHVYHFCIPPTAFVCEECTSSFSRAVALKVHKRLHSGDRPYGCEECAERFISKKLLAKHEASHREPEKPVEIAAREKTPEKEPEESKNSVEAISQPDKAAETNTAEATATEEKKPKEVVKKVVDVYDLPPLNLSSESDSDSEDQAPPESTATASKEAEEKKEETKPEEIHEATATEPAANSLSVDVADAVVDPELNEEVKKEEAQIMDGIWDNFKSYAASLEKPTLVEPTVDEKKEEARLKFLCEVILADHDYCVVSSDKSGPEELKEDAKTEDNCGTMEGEHDYGYKQSKSPSAGSAVLNCDSDTNAKKKKEKSPKKRKQNGSTSSSDSSSDSDSSSCSCGTNCSCSSSSSGSSSSSSSSSDSDSSASESSPKKSSARKERKKEKEKEVAAAAAAKNEAKIEETAAPVEDATPHEDPPQPQQNDEGNQSIEICEPPRSPQLVLRESDLDTDETETDEDFYDEHPQQLANKLLAEKRNQLMLLAAVAPASTESAVASGAASVANNLNNGALDTETLNANSMEVSAATNVDGEARNSNARGQTRKRVKTKKRKKADRAKSNRVSTPTVESIKLNIPKSFYQKKQPGYGTPAIITVLPSRSSTPSLQNSQPEAVNPFTPEATKANVRLSVGGSGSENENKRSSKRKRVPKRFYGDSSDEEAERQQQLQQQQQQQQPQQSQQLQQQVHYTQPSLKWRKVENTPLVPSISIKTQPQPSVNYPTKNVTIRLSGFDQPMERVVPMNAAASATESEEPAESSSAESSEAEENVEQPAQPQPVQQPPQPPPPPPIAAPNPGILAANSTGGPERNVNLYCYCQCPYDEVSEMIACDGDDCRIEWFHFECVGIMVPPKGKWYCPDCRKKDGSLPSNDDYFD